MKLLNVLIARAIIWIGISGATTTGIVGGAITNNAGEINYSMTFVCLLPNAFIRRHCI